VVPESRNLVTFESVQGFAADLTADEHYGQVQASIKAREMGHYGESHEDNRAFIADVLQLRAGQPPRGGHPPNRPAIARASSPDPRSGACLP